MNLLFRVLFATNCRSTHHKMALDALCHLRGPQAEKWRNLFLKHHDVYLEGAKVPDTRFKDFRNHVLHVREDFWGGAPATAARWYAQTVQGLRNHDWKTAAYCAGVLSHYYTDPLMPFHTAQSQAENNIHRAAEWSITRSYDAIRELLETRLGYPRLAAPDGPGWLEEMVRDGARLSNPYYETLIEHYDFDRGVKDPPAGLDDVSRELLARVIGHAVVGFARILERAFDEAGVAPPAVSVTLQGFLAALQVPIRWVTNRLADARERAVVEAMYTELRETGKVELTLPEDERVVRELHHKEVVLAGGRPGSFPQEPVLLKMPVRAPASPEPGLKFHLEPTSPVADAPSVGPRTEERLNAVGVRTVADLLAHDPAALATSLGVAHVTEQTVADWQDQARLACRIPRVRGHDVQILVACGYRTPEAVAAATPRELLAAADAFVSTAEGQRVLRGGKPPDMDEVNNWICWARQARTLKAA